MRQIDHIFIYGIQNKLFPFTRYFLPAYVPSINEKLIIKGIAHLQSPEFIFLFYRDAFLLYFYFIPSDFHVA